MVKPTPKISLEQMGLLLFMADIFLSIHQNAFVYVVLGGLGGLIGSLIRIVKRDEADVLNKQNFLYLKDLFVITVWSLAGAYFSLVFGLIGAPAALAALPSPFMPTFYDLLEKYVPGFMMRWLANRNGNGNANGGGTKPPTINTTNSESETK